MILKSKKGNAFFTPCVITLFFAMLLSVTVIYTELLSVTAQFRQQTKLAADRLIEEQLIGQFGQIRQGEAPAISIDRADLEQRLGERYPVDARDGSFLLTRSDGSPLCRYRIVEVKEEGSVLFVSGEAKFPVVFCGESVGSVCVPIRTESCLKEKF